MLYNNYNLNVESDFEIRLVREDSTDFDLFVPIDYKVLNILFHSIPKYLDNRIQCPRVYGILIRGAKSFENNRASVFILKNVDLNSAATIFEIDYSNLSLAIKNLENTCEFELKIKKSGY